MTKRWHDFNVEIDLEVPLKNYGDGIWGQELRIMHVSFTVVECES